MEESNNPKPHISKKLGKFNKVKQADFLKAIVKRRGNVMAACELAKCSRKQFYTWLQRDPIFKKNYKACRKEMEDILFEKACDLGEAGDTTALIFTLKSLNRARFDDRYAAQKYAIKKGANITSDVTVPVRAMLVREEEPFAVPKPVIEDGLLEEH